MHEYNTRSYKNKSVYKELECHKPPISKEAEKELLGILENQVNFLNALDALCDKLDT